MTEEDELVAKVLKHLKKTRLESQISPETIEKQLMLGPGWIEALESGESPLELNMLLLLMQEYKADPAEVMISKEELESNTIQRNRNFWAESTDDGITVHFVYSRYNATYTLKGASLAQFDNMLRLLRNGLAKIPSGELDDNKIKSDAITKAFLYSVNVWKNANPSDIWWFIIYRAFCDPFNHPATSSRLDFAQSWKRSGGWALENIVVRHYQKALEAEGISIEIPSAERKRKLADSIVVKDRIEKDKIDIFLVGPNDEVFGIVNVKASLAERRTDDVPMSRALIEGGYCSFLWTMDCKSGPSERPENRGEIGHAGKRRSAKRKDIEDDGYFSACFSYNARTEPSSDMQAVTAPIFCCDFQDPEDAFFQQVKKAYEEFCDKKMSNGRKV